MAFLPHLGVPTSRRRLFFQAFTYIPPTTKPSAVWAAVGRDIGLQPKSKDRFLTWLWTGYDFGEATLAHYSAMATAIGVDVVMVRLFLGSVWC